MPDVGVLLELVEQEAAAAAAEAQTADFLSLEALLSLGRAIDNLSVVSHGRGTVTLECPDNPSRFREGDRLVLQCGPARLRGTLAELSHAGRRCVLQVPAARDSLPVGPWVAVEERIDLLGSVRSVLQKLTPGAPGWTFFRRVMGEIVVAAPTGDDGAGRALCQALMRESGQALDDSQMAVVAACAGAPPLLGVQGPPGTGKTLVLAFACEALLRQGKRVAVVAPTHQAVNNALSTVKSLFPDREVLKVGDALRRESLADTIGVSPAYRSCRDQGTVAGMTYMAALHQLMLAPGGSVLPNVLLIDEAGQLPLTQGACAGLCGAGSVQLFGDDRQMPPVFAAVIAEEPWALSVFAQLRHAQPQALLPLRVTYRLNDELCRGVSRAFYAGRGDAGFQPSATA
ncbi:MAG: AAA family ATPase, partial [Chloroflexi bacterium]|nr:AAA family ATPase [Chloroflexota bacterium]